LRRRPLSPDLNEAKERRLIAREKARTEAAAAEHAAKVFLAERAEASAAAGRAKEATDRVLRAVLALTAETIAWEHEQLLAQAAVRRDALFGFNRFSANLIPALPPMTRKVLGNDMAQFARARDTSSWRSAADRLREDPQAPIEIALAKPAEVPTPTATMFALAPRPSPHAVWIGDLELEAKADPEEAA
jgi:hypothetical protein